MTPREPSLETAKTTAVDEAYRGLRSAILEGRYELGAPLSEVQLAQDLSVSRTPVREAMRRLATEGLIDLSFNRVARVATWTGQDLNEVYELRAVLESYAASRAATMITPDTLALLRELNEQEEQAVRSAEPDRVESVIRLNATFHRTLVEAAQNQRLSGLIIPLIEIPSVLRFARANTEHHLHCNWRDHETVVEALSNGDGDWAAAVMRGHMLGEKARLIREREELAAAPEPVTSAPEQP